MERRDEGRGYKIRDGKSSRFKSTVSVTSVVLRGFGGFYTGHGNRLSFNLTSNSVCIAPLRKFIYIYIYIYIYITKKKKKKL